MAHEELLRWWLWGCNLVPPAPWHHGSRGSSWSWIGIRCSCLSTTQSRTLVFVMNSMPWKPDIPTSLILFLKRSDIGTSKMSILLSRNSGICSIRHARPVDSFRGSEERQEIYDQKTFSSITRDKSRFSTSTQWLAEWTTIRRRWNVESALIWHQRNSISLTKG